MAKRKIALLIAYIGAPFHGLQCQSESKSKEDIIKQSDIENKQDIESKENNNPIESEKIKDDKFNDINNPTDINISDNTVPTIEKHLIQKLSNHNLIKKINANPKKCHVYRSCRTDKGVSAILNLVTVSVENSDRKSFLDEFKDIDVHNDKFIKVYKIINVSQRMNAKNAVFERVYSYLLPKSIFQANVSHNDTKNNLENDEIKNIHNCNIDEVNNLLENICENYIGTKSFHNFTKKNTKDPKSPIRFIKEIKIINHNSWLEIEIKGQSFILHQIRKMVGLVILIMWYTKKEEIFIKNIFNKVFSKNSNFNIPKAPPNFLFLKNVSFELYNKNYKKLENFEKIEIDENEYQNNLDFIRNYLMKDENVFDGWKECIEKHLERFEYLKE